MLKEKIQSDIKDALKSGDKEKRLVLSILMAAIKNKELNKRGQLSKTTINTSQLDIQSQLNDEEVLEAISSEVKKRKESIEQFTAGNRPELAAKEKSEMAILSIYLPEQMSENDIKQEAVNAIKELGATTVKDMGKVVGRVMSKFKNKVDGGLVSKIIKELLS